MSSTVHPMTPVVPPKVMQDVFTPDETATLFSVLRTNGPWPQLLSHHFENAEQLFATSGGKRPGKDKLSDYLTPVFRDYLADAGIVFEHEVHEIFYSRRLLELVKGMHGAAYASPRSFLFNITTPSEAGSGAHFDGCAFRGMDPTNSPIWLLSVMAKSGLFDSYEVKSGQVVTYFYDLDIDGGFTYWPDGPDAPPQHIAAPWWNKGILTDNQRMFHRGESSGDPSLRAKPDGLGLDSSIEAIDGGWAVKNGDEVLAEYENRQVRILFHYSANVYRDKDELIKVKDHADDLTADRVIDVLLDDARRRGTPIEAPSDRLSDPEFIKAISTVYAMAPTTTLAPQG